MPSDNIFKNVGLNTYTSSNKVNVNVGGIMMNL